MSFNHQCESECGIEYWEKGAIRISSSVADDKTVFSWLLPSFQFYFPLIPHAASLVFSLISNSFVPCCRCTFSKSHLKNWKESFIYNLKKHKYPINVICTICCCYCHRRRRRRRRRLTISMARQCWAHENIWDVLL